MSNFLSFLSNVVVETIEPGKASTGGAKKQRNPNPTFPGIRIWADGSVYPSEALVDTYNMEYPEATVTVVKDKDGKDKSVLAVTGDPGFGLDVINSTLVQHWKSPQPFIAIAITPKDSPKVDLFGTTRYDAAGKPLATVMEQGSATFGKTVLLPMLKEVYNVEPNAEGFLDLEISTAVNLRSANGLELFPKIVSRGADKGKNDFIRRENVDIFGLSPVISTVVEVKAATIEEVEEN